MAIDISLETVFPLRDAARHIPRRRKGRKAAVSTLHRWATSGIRGVILETIQVGGTRCTSFPALQRFFDRLSGRPEALTAGEADRRHERAERELERLMRPRHRGGSRAPSN
jgi:hypothetical protein